MIKQVMFGILVFFIGSLGFIFTEVIGHKTTSNATCMFNSISSVPINLSYHWMMIPILVSQIGACFIYIGVIKFVIAQSPYQMKSLLFGIFFGISGMFRCLGLLLIQCFLLSPALMSSPNCGLYYYVGDTLLTGIVLIVLAILSALYKLRQRNNPLNVHLIVGDHVERYIAQRETMHMLSDSHTVGTNTY